MLWCHLSYIEKYRVLNVLNSSEWYFKKKIIFHLNSSTICQLLMLLQRYNIIKYIFRSYLQLPFPYITVNINIFSQNALGMLFYEYKCNNFESECITF